MEVLFRIIRGIIEGFVTAVVWSIFGFIVLSGVGFPLNSGMNLVAMIAIILGIVVFVGRLLGK